MKHSVFLSLLIVLTCCAKQKPTIISSEFVTVNVTEHSQNNKISQWLLPHKTMLDKVMNEKIGFSEMELTIELPESPLGNFITEIMINYAEKHNKKCDFAITNIGGLREPLPVGDITVGDVYRTFPFDNELVILTLSGKKVEQLCQEIARQGGQITNGIKMFIDNGIAKNIKIGNPESPLDTNKNYKALTTDYLSFGNDELFALAEYSEIYSFKTPLREIIIKYIIEHL
jgi:2',3'-cyclic-nucleotide 2'-phosphodiesterase (5'-nucleotidase family)